MPELKQLRVLAAVAATGSFSRAAARLNYTQPAVSRIVAALERELGAVLVERECRPVRLTDAGAALVRHADDVFAWLSSARAEIEAINHVEAGSVSLGTFSSAGTSFVVDALSEFRKRHPAVRVSIGEGSMPSALVRRVRAGDFDLAVVFDYPAAGEDIGAGLELHHLTDVPWDIVLHRSHRLTRRRRVRAADLADEEWLLPDFGPESPSLRLINRMCASAGFEPRVAFRVNDCHMNQALVAAGEGVTILPRLLLHPLHPGVVARCVDDDPPTMRVAAVRLPTRFLAPAVAKFLAVLKDAARRRADSWTAPETESGTARDVA
ncbi:MAG TPA: LysR family transcriptional regulator [Gaiellaceae bacterium]|nr:LysR family transcriptional regulator [Gaiellaceae bacterium]